MQQRQVALQKAPDPLPHWFLSADWGGDQGDGLHHGPSAS